MSSQSYGVSLKGDINQLEKVQKRAAKLVYGHQKVSYEERLRRLGLTTLQQRRLTVSYTHLTLPTNREV